jgi:hypothetical protein
MYCGWEVGMESGRCLISFNAIRRIGRSQVAPERFPSLFSGFGMSLGTICKL